MASSPSPVASQLAEARGKRSKVTAMSARTRIVAAGLVGLFLTSACGLFTLEDPYDDWSVNVVYREEDDGEVVADPDVVEAVGPTGEVEVRNSTEEERRFVIEELGIFRDIPDDETVRIEITGLEDGQSYTFVDDSAPGGPTGTIVVSFVRVD